MAGTVSDYRSLRSNSLEFDFLSTPFDWVGTILGTDQNRESFRSCNWCERGDLNPHGFTRQILSLVRLPIPPLSHNRIEH